MIMNINPQISLVMVHLQSSSKAEINRYERITVHEVFINCVGKGQGKWISLWLLGHF